MTSKPPVRRRVRRTSVDAAPAPVRLANGRFGPGYCGNRRGRPRKTADPRPIAQRVLEETISLKVDGRRVRMSIEEALFRKIFERALLEAEPVATRIAARFLFKRLTGAPQPSLASDPDQAMLAGEPLTAAETEMFERFMASLAEEGQ